VAVRIERIVSDSAGAVAAGAENVAFVLEKAIERELSASPKARIQDVAGAVERAVRMAFEQAAKRGA
jgi:hypothetical protein